MRACAYLSLSLLTALAAAACGRDAPANPDAGPDAGDVIGGDRPVTVHVPASYDPATPAPLVVLLHGYTANSLLQEAYFQLTPQSEAHGFIYAMPDGTVDSQGNQFWNATDACCDFGGTGVDDAGYLRGVIEDIQRAFTIDPARIYLVGHSNGGFMAHRMACDHADVVAGIASLAGVTFADPERCQPSEPVSVLQIHGSVDATILFGGGDILGAAYPGAVETVEAWAAADGCAAQVTAGEPIDLESQIAGAETQVLRRESECAPGGHAELWTIAGGGHVPGFTPAFAPSVIEFLLAHPKPE